MFFWKFVLVTVLLSGLLEDFLVEARSNGENIDTACAEMVPFHRASPQTTASPYKIAFSPETYTPGTPVSVTISSCTAKSFKGFLIQARRGTVGSNQTEMLGSFTAVTGAQQTCNGNGLIHDNAVEKTTLTFQWNPPAVSEGHIQFWVTFVEIKTTFWAAVKSDVLRDASISTAPSPGSVESPSPVVSDCATATPSLPAGHFEKDPNCGTDNCFSDCGSNGCSFHIIFSQVGTRGSYTIKTKAVGTSNMYAAIGFSYDDKMGDDSVSGCAYKGGNVQPFNAKNEQYPPTTMLALDGVAVTASSRENDIFSCTFERDIAEGLDGNRFDLNFAWYLLFARGPYENDTVGYHVYKLASTQRFSLTGSTQIVTQQPSNTDPPLVNDSEL